MHGEDGDDEKNRHWDGGEGNEGSEEDGEATEDLGENGDPRHEVRSGCAESLKDGGEVIGTAAEFCESVLHESESDDEAEGERCPACEATLRGGVAIG